ncbi:MAG: 6-bladed beta-propeller, partial [Burkholderiales bacterium]
MGAQSATMSLFLLLATIAIGACTVAPRTPETAQPHPVFPPPPEEPRFIYERSLYSSADMLQDSDTDTFRRFVTGEKRAGEAFAKPYGVAVHQGRVYVSDTVRRVVMMFDVPGKRFAQIGGDDPGSLRLPLGLDVDGAGNLYVCDGTTKYVQVYDSSGKYLRQFAGPEWLHRPTGLAVTRTGDRVYVVDTGGVGNQDHRVRVFDAATGKHLLDFGARGDGPGEFNLPRDIAIAPDGTLFVVDGGNFRVQVFDKNGKY